MRLTKNNIKKYLNEWGNLDLYGNEKITHIDYLPDNITYISITNVEEITCELPEGLKQFYSHNSKLNRLPLLPKSLITFTGLSTNLPIEYQVYIYDDNVDCNRLRKLQLLELI